MNQTKEDFYISSEDSYAFYKLFYEVSQLLEKNGIVYWITAGTFLGAVRSGGIIKWDDDIDIMIPVEYREKLYKLFKDDDTFYVYSNIMCITHDKISYRNNDKIFIDIFYGSPNLLNGTIVFDHHNFICNYLWPNEYFYLDEFFPL